MEGALSWLRNPRPDADPAQVDLDPDPDLDPGLDLAAAQDLVTAAVTKADPNPGAVADLLHPKIVLEADPGPDLLIKTGEMTARMVIARADLAQEIVEDQGIDPGTALGTDPDQEVP